MIKILKRSLLLMFALSASVGVAAESLAISPGLLKVVQNSCTGIDHDGFHARGCLNRGVKAMIDSKTPQDVFLEACAYYGDYAGGHGDLDPVLAYNQCLSSLLSSSGLEKEVDQCSGGPVKLYGCYVHVLSSPEAGKKINARFAVASQGDAAAKSCQAKLNSLNTFISSQNPSVSTAKQLARQVHVILQSSEKKAGTSSAE